MIWALIALIAIGLIAMSAFGIKEAVWVVLAALVGLGVVRLLWQLGFVSLARYHGDKTTTRKD